MLRLMVAATKVRAVGASMINDNTLSLSCGLLDLHDATIVSEVKTASDAELLLDFLLHVCSWTSSAGLRKIANL